MSSVPGSVDGARVARALDGSALTWSRRPSSGGRHAPHDALHDALHR
jgi:hypothetical protein